MTGGGGLPAKNNSLDNFWYEGDLPPENDCAQWGCVVDEATVYHVQGPWPPAAQAIMDAAGAPTLPW